MFTAMTLSSVGPADRLPVRRLVHLYQHSCLALVHLYLRRIDCRFVVWDICPNISEIVCTNRIVAGDICPKIPPRWNS